MRHLGVMAVAGAIALAITGCGSEEPTTTAVSPSPLPSPAVTQKSTATQNFTKPLVAQKPSTPSAAIPGLIQSTNGNERARQVQASIAARRGGDPFEALPTEIPRLPTPTPTNVPSVRRLPPASPRPTSALRPGTLLTPPKTPARTTPRPPAIATLPPLPSADLANGVEVTGVVRVGNTVQAIVRAPNEPTSRYVGIGQRLSNGQVLVKRIDLNAGADPIVILEQNGVEVPRVVGASAVQPQRPGETPQPPA